MKKLPAVLQHHLNRLVAAESASPRWSFIAILAAITWLGFSRLMAEGLGDELTMYGSETLRAVQAWENHGLLAWAGFFPLGSTYLPANHVIQSHEIYQSYPPFYLLVYWPSYHWFGEAGFRLFKLAWALAYGIALGALLGALASACFARARVGYRQLVFATAYVMTISNQAVLRYFLIDEPDYMGLLFVVLGAFLLMRNWVSPQPAASRRRPWVLWLVWFFGSWIYPVLGAISLLSVFGLQRLRLEPRLRASLRTLLPPLMAGVVLYLIQRIVANLVFPSGLKGSTLFGRMGLHGDVTNSHKGVLSALHFLVWQQPGSMFSKGSLAVSQLVEQDAIWIIGILLFVVVMTRLKGPVRQLILVLAAAQAWLLVPLLHQSLAHHDWIYAIHFVPSVVFGWVGALAYLVPLRSKAVFPHWLMAFAATLIWAIQMRFFMVAYLS